MQRVEPYLRIAGELALGQVAVFAAGAYSSAILGVQQLHPTAGPVDNGVSRVQSLHPGPPTGCNHCGNGVHLLPERGTAAAPAPSLEPSRDPPATRAAAHDPGAAAVVGQPEAGGGVEFFSRLWPSW